MDEEYWKIENTLKLIKIAKEERKNGVLGEMTITKDYINHLSTNMNLMREGQRFGEKKKLEEVIKIINELPANVLNDFRKKELKIRLTGDKRK